MQMHTCTLAGVPFTEPRIGFIDGGDFIDQREALARDLMTPADAALLECLNYPDNCITDAMPHDGLDDAVRIVQDSSLINTGDVAGLFCGGDFGGMDAESYWLNASDAQRKAFLFAYLAFEGDMSHV